MKFITDADGIINTTGSSYQGYIYSSYEDLLILFGKPIISNDEKAECQWVLMLEDGHVATIYAWKENYKTCKKWNVGGKSKECYYIVDDIIQDYKMGVR